LPFGSLGRRLRLGLRLRLRRLNAGGKQAGA
jgi:hypothetical protein